jgi:hypothetical protein
MVRKMITTHKKLNGGSKFVVPPTPNAKQRWVNILISDIVLNRWWVKIPPPKNHFDDSRKDNAGRE